MWKKFTLPIFALLAGCAETATNNVAADADDDVARILRDYATVSTRTWAGVGTLTCRFGTAQACGPDGCQRAEVTTWVKWIPATSTYERCDQRGCDNYQATVSYSGGFATISLPDNGAMMRLTGRNRAMEVVTQFETAIVRHGQCQP